MKQDAKWHGCSQFIMEQLQILGSCTQYGYDLISVIPKGGLTSREGRRWCEFVAPFIAKEGPEDVDAAARGVGGGLDVALSFGAFTFVEAAGLVGPPDADEGGSTEDTLSHWLQHCDRRRLPLIFLESRGAGATPPKPATWSVVSETDISPPVATRNSAPGMMPRPNMPVVTSK